jgi:AcrR family transcriptional regulator
MPKKEAPEEIGGSTWRQRAVTRSLSSARTRIEQRIQRFLDAARALIEEQGSSEFTIQQVVERSNQSLRSFYQYFDGKDELLFAVFEEVAAETIEALEAATQTQSESLERLRAFVFCLHEHSAPQQPVRDAGKFRTHPIPELCWNLAQRDPRRIARVMAPISLLLTELIEAANFAGRIQVADPHHAAVLVQQTVMCGWVLGRMTQRPESQVTAETAWNYCFQGLAG